MCLSHVPGYASLSESCFPAHFTVSLDPVYAPTHFGHSARTIPFGRAVNSHQYVSKYVHVCFWVCVWVLCACVWVHAGACACRIHTHTHKYILYIYIDIDVCVCVCVCARKYTYINVFMYIHVNIFIRIYIRTHIYSHMHLYIHVHIYIHICIYIHTYIYVYEDMYDHANSSFAWPGRVWAGTNEPKKDVQESTLQPNSRNLETPAPESVSYDQMYAEIWRPLHQRGFPMINMYVSIYTRTYMFIVKTCMTTQTVHLPGQIGRMLAYIHVYRYTYI